jgi:3-oxoadipate enol-lactonase
VRTVVLLGSLGATSTMWDAQATALAGRFHQVRLEHPGHGGTPSIEVTDVADLAEHVLAQVDAERFSFVGLSLGGAVGMHMALGRARERLDKLVLACTSARFGEPDYWRERAATVRSEGLEAIVDAVLERWFTPAFRDVRRYRAMFLSNEHEAYARCCEALAGWDVRGGLTGVDVPTLAIAAVDDPATPPQHLRSIAQEIPGARLELIRAARHLPNVERADEFNGLLADFL